MKREPSRPRGPSRPVVLIGSRGAGKSTVGRELARLLGWRFVDLDRRIEQQAGSRVAALFREEGEAGFRRRESRALLSLAAEPSVVAAGGGVVERAENRRFLTHAATCVWLQVERSVLRERLRQGPERPSITGRPPADEVDLLMRRRGPHYRHCADFTVRCGAAPPAAIAARVAARLRRLGLVAAAPGVRAAAGLPRRGRPRAAGSSASPR